MDRARSDFQTTALYVRVTVRCQGTAGEETQGSMYTCAQTHSHTTACCSNGCVRARTSKPTFNPKFSKWIRIGLFTCSLLNPSVG